jgi:hypothetical protein
MPIGFQEGRSKKIVFAAQKNSGNLNTGFCEKIFGRSLESAIRFAKSVRRQAPDLGLLRGFPAHLRPMSLFEGCGHANREPKGL